jgi:SAM-dependent methyltransferase
MSAACPICGATAARRLYRLTRFSIYACASCAQVFLAPLPSEEEIRTLFAQLYTTGESDLPELRDYYGFCYDDAPSNPLVQLYGHWLDALERHHPPGTLLDVGCGTGLFLAVARRRGWRTVGIDDCEPATRYAREHFGLEVQTGEFADFARDGRSFDAITMWDIIEHARRPVDLLTAARGCLAPGGVVGLSTPNQQSILDVVAGSLYRATGGRITAPLEKFYIAQHFLYFDPTTLAHALERAGLGVVHLERELTDLRRLALAPPVRLALTGLFQVARWTGLENRLFAVARAGVAS